MNDFHASFSRRECLFNSLAAAFAPFASFAASPGRLVGVTDWTIGARSSLEAFDLAKEIGLSSIQASFDPTLGLDELDLKEERHREAILEKAESTGVAIASTAMGILNGQPFKEVPEAVGWVKEGIAVTEALGETVMLLAFFGKNDLKGDAEGTAETIRRLKEVAPVAEEKGIVLGLETTLDIDEHLHIIESVGSKAVQVYYDLGNSHGNGYDIASEIRQLGSDLICEVHCKDKGGWLFGPGEVPFAEATKALIEIGYDSWLILEGGTAEGMEKLETLQKNAEFLREIGLATA